jgi:hypothetical protein
MAGQQTGGRGAVVYWIGWGLLLVAVVTVVWILFRSPTELGF